MIEYRRRPQESDVVKAVQWNKPGDHPDVLHAYGSHRLTWGDRSVGDVYYGQHVHPGDWIVESEDEIDVMRDAEFRATYTLAAPPADAGGGDAIDAISRALSSWREGRSIVIEVRGGVVVDARIEVGPDSLRALLAAAERPGPATRKVLELLATRGANGYARELRRRMAVDLESGDTALHPEHEELIAAALAENGMTEAPR